MKFKRVISALLLVVFISGTSMLSFVKANEVKQNSLREFINENENININYEYPAYKQSISATNKIKIPAHTPLIIRAENKISSNGLSSGDNIYFKTVNPIKNEEGKILINANSPVSAEIIFEKPKRVGKPGELTISNFHTVAVDGSYVPLSATISLEGDDKLGLSLTLSLIICPLFLLMRGGKAELPAGTTKTVYTAGDVYIKINSH